MLVARQLIQPQYQPCEAVEEESRSGRVGTGAVAPGRQEPQAEGPQVELGGNHERDEQAGDQRTVAPPPDRGSTERQGEADVAEMPRVEEGGGGEGQPVE